MKKELDCKITEGDDKLQREINTLRKRLDEYEKGVDNKIKTNVTCTAEEGIKEMADREERKLSLMIFKVPESRSEDTEERKKHDVVEFNKIQETIGTKAVVKNISRVGIRGAQDRPLKVKVSTESEHKDILRSAKKLQGSDRFRNIYINRDMTPLERQQLKTLLAERKRKQEQSEEEGSSARWIIRKGRVVRGRDKKDQEVEDV